MSAVRQSYLAQAPPEDLEVRAAELETIDLLNDFDGLLGTLWTVLDRAAHESEKLSSTLDAYLLAAGIDQVAEDYLHAQPHLFSALDRRLQARRTAQTMVKKLAAGAFFVSAHRDSETAAWHTRFRDVVALLASATIALTGGHSEAEPVQQDLWRALQYLEGARSSASGLPLALRSSILRLPDCYNSFDMRPEDCHRFAAEVAARWPNRRTPLLVVGVRTSGSYLAPLQGAALARLGYERVGWVTYRPGQHWRAGELGRIEEARDGGGLALVVDDPPVTGSKLAETADAIEELGFAPRAVVLLVPLLGSEATIPSRLHRRELVALPWHEWACQAQLEDGAIASTLTDLVKGQCVAIPRQPYPVTASSIDRAKRVRLEPIDDVTARPLSRSHLRARYRARLKGADGSSHLLDVYVKGTGLGYFGRHSLLLARRLEGLVPRAYGWQDGLLFRQALPERARVTGATELDERKVAVAVAGHVAERAERLRVREDKGARLRRRGALWERASDVLVAPFGRAAPLLGPIARRAVRDLVAVESPSVVDASTAAPHWMTVGGEEQELVKVDFDERAFSVWDLWCYDPVWDLAIAAADHTLRAASGRGRPDDFGFERVLLEEYERRAGRAVDPHRWFLYQIVHLGSVRGHLSRLLRDGPSHLQTTEGAPPAVPAVEEAGFEAELRRFILGCDVALDVTARRLTSELDGRAPGVAQPESALLLRTLGLPGPERMARLGALWYLATLAFRWSPLESKEHQ